jgi:hypothetical protein
MELQTHAQETSETQARKIINELFKQLKALCPLHNIAWPEQEVYDTAKRLWLDTFIEKGLSSWDKIQFGLRKLRDSNVKYAPTVTEFIALCYPTREELGIPSAQESYIQCCKRASGEFYDDVFTHATIAYLYGRSPKERFQNAVKRDDELAFKYDYELVVRAFMNGEPYPELTKAVTHDKLPDGRPCRKIEFEALLKMCRRNDNV